MEHVHCMSFPDSGKFRGIAFVTLGSEDAYAAALGMNGGYVDDCALVVKPAKPTTQEGGKKDQHNSETAEKLLPGR